jgi:hypothetical protein
MVRAVKNNVIMVIAAAVISLLSLVTFSHVAYADNNVNIDNSVKCGSNIDGLSGGGCNSNVSGSSNQLEDLIRTIINVFSVIVGSVSVIMIIIGGFRYITSGGDSNNVGGAKNTILYAIVGLIIVAFAQVIVQFVLQRAV